MRLICVSHNGTHMISALLKVSLIELLAAILQRVQGSLKYPDIPRNQAVHLLATDLRCSVDLVSPVCITIYHISHHSLGKGSQGNPISRFWDHWWLWALIRAYWKDLALLLRL